jgi:hypothetical protein
MADCGGAGEGQPNCRIVDLPYALVKVAPQVKAVVRVRALLLGLHIPKDLFHVWPPGRAPVYPYS